MQRRLLATLARLPGRRFPIKGWTLVSEQLHAAIVRGQTEALYRTAWGVTMRLDLGDWTQRCIFYDAYEADELNLMLGVIRPGTLVLDVGANVGLFALVAALAVSVGGEVHAFEPVPANCERLRQNLDLNDVSNVVMRQVAVGQQAGSVCIGLDASSEPSSGLEMSGAFTIGGRRRQLAVPMVTLDAYLAQALPQRRIAFAKVDVEGYEPAVLAGLRETLANELIDVLIVEVNQYGLRRHGWRIADVVEPLTAAGYELYRLHIGGWLTMWKYQTEPALPERVSGSVSMVQRLRMGIEDVERHFNLVAIRGTHLAIAGKPRFLRRPNLRQRAWAS
jgi:FkbM family methyltransferase